MITLNIGQRTRLQEIHYSPHMVEVCLLVKRSQKHTLMKIPQELIKEGRVHHYVANVYFEKT